MGTGRTISLVSLPSLLPSLLPGPVFNLFNINKPPIQLGGGQPSVVVASPLSPGPGSAPAGGVYVVNSAGTAGAAAPSRS